MESQKFVKLIDSALNFVDLFGDNFNTTKLSEIVELSSTKDGKICIKNIFGTVKSYEFSEKQFQQIIDEIASCVENFNPKYPGYVVVHSSSYGNKLILTISTKIWLDGTNSYRERTAVITIDGKKSFTRFNISETFAV
jgi:hypothetical protein